ncbi:transposase [Helicobacter pylori]|nr:transposase [Helicobacter pylori]WQU94774.1 transposase [Helicobacter pylori]
MNRDRGMRKNHYPLRGHISTNWTDGFFVCSIGEANLETIKAYIENQG